MRCLSSRGVFNTLEPSEHHVHLQLHAEPCLALANAVSAKLCRTGRCHVFARSWAVRLHRVSVLFAGLLHVSNIRKRTSCYALLLACISPLTFTQYPRSYCDPHSRRATCEYPRTDTRIAHRCPPCSCPIALTNSASLTILLLSYRARTHADTDGKGVSVHRQTSTTSVSPTT